MRRFEKTLKRYWFHRPTGLQEAKIIIFKQSGVAGKPYGVQAMNLGVVESYETLEEAEHVAKLYGGLLKENGFVSGGAK